MKLDYLLSHSLINSYKFTAKAEEINIHMIKDSNRCHKSKWNRNNQTNHTPIPIFRKDNIFCFTLLFGY